MSEFRLVRLRLLRPRRFSRLLRSLKDRRSRISYFRYCCMVIATEEAAKNLCCWVSILPLATSLILLPNKVLELLERFATHGWNCPVQS